MGILKAAKVRGLVRRKAHYSVRFWKMDTEIGF